MFAQTEKNKIQFNVGPEFAYPIGTTNKVTELGVGASFKAVVDVVKDVKWTFSTGFMSLRGKDVKSISNPNVVVENPNIEFIPIKSGFRINVMKKFFIEPEAVIRLGTNYQSKAGFGFAGGLGYNFKIKNNPMDFSVRYENTYYKGAPLSFLAARVGISFPR